jgi:type VI secretion system secreted protein VgrG
VKVQFCWDRKGKNDEKSSCWVRVSSVWAGKGFGWVHIPRIGEEVVVDFLEGDPDRPLITGRVYNDKHVPPWPLPGEQTKAGLRTRSSKGGGEKNYNELWFEDKKGSEMVFLHAERGLTTEVEVDEVRAVGNNRTTTIEKDDKKTVKKGEDRTTVSEGDQFVDVEKGDQNIYLGQGNQSVTIDQGAQTIQVNKDQKTTIKTGDQLITLEMGDQNTRLKQGSHITQVDMGDHDTAVKMGNQKVVLDLGKISHEAMQGIELKVGQSSIKLDQMGVTIKGMMIQIEGQIQTQVKGTMTQINGNAMLQMQGGITMIG